MRTQDTCQPNAQPPLNSVTMSTLRPTPLKTCAYTRYNQVLRQQTSGSGSGSGSARVLDAPRLRALPRGDGKEVLSGGSHNWQGGEGVFYIGAPALFSTLLEEKVGEAMDGS